MKNSKTKNLFKIAERIRSIDYNARIHQRSKVEDIIWLTDLVRNLEYKLDLYRTELHEERDLRRTLESERFALRRSQREWEERLWVLTETSLEVLDHTQSDLNTLNSAVQEVIKFNTTEDSIPTAFTSVVCSHTLSQLSEASEYVTHNQESFKSGLHLDPLENSIRLKTHIPKEQLPFIGNMMNFGDSQFPLNPSEHTDPTNPRTPGPLKQAGILKNGKFSS